MFDVHLANCSAQGGVEIEPEFLPFSLPIGPFPAHLLAGMHIRPIVTSRPPVAVVTLRVGPNEVDLSDEKDSVYRAVLCQIGRWEVDCSSWEIGAREAVERRSPQCWPDVQVHRYEGAQGEC